jgi:hypothetical protein
VRQDIIENFFGLFSRFRSNVYYEKGAIISNSQRSPTEKKHMGATEKTKKRGSYG